LAARIGSALLAVIATAQEPQLVRHNLLLQGKISETPYELRGAALDGTRLIAWGEVLVDWKLPAGRPRVLVRGDFQEGGCLTDLDGDGQIEFVGQEGSGLGSLTWRKTPAWKPERIDSNVEMHDCTGATLFGRSGLLMIHRYGQVRFYERPAKPAGRWPYREIYSFYTASRQGGLLLHDVDGDGFTDIITGNYWIRGPKSFELPWRLFAINTDHTTPDAATSRFAFLDPARLVVSQGHLWNGKLSIFVRPSDPTQLWIEHRLNPDRTLAKPHGLDTADLDGDGDREILVAENAGEAARIFVVWQEGQVRFRAAKIDSLGPVHTLKGVDLNADGKPDIVAVGARSVTWWENRYPLRK
jgi:hypothetical protein